MCAYLMLVMCSLVIRLYSHDLLMMSLCDHLVVRSVMGTGKIGLNNSF